MTVLISTTTQSGEQAALAAMFVARKQVFIDLLKWELPVIDGRYEIDKFDDQHARYLILTDDHGAHLGSARLLPTRRPHLLDSLFGGLCGRRPPRGENVYEITRFCLDRNLRAHERRQVRNQLVTAIAQYALDNDITAYVGVAEAGWLQQILAFGWESAALGAIADYSGKALGALEIFITRDTPALLARTGIWAPIGCGSVGKQLAGSEG